MNDTELAVNLLEEIDKLKKVLREAYDWIDALDEYEHYGVSISRGTILSKIDAVTHYPGD